jgi:predicted RNase H-like HicB family nuclease
MIHYVAIIEESGPETAVGIWFPDLPGCFSAGDDIDDALHNAPDALSLYAEGLAEEGRELPRARSITELRADPAIAADLDEYAVALVPMRVLATSEAG